MSSIYFTLCSNNYLAHAGALGDSIHQFDPKVRFIIGLVDRIDSAIDYAKFDSFELLPFEDIEYPEFQEMLLRYNIIEFNTAVKPYYFEYLFRINKEADRIYYIDPDILLFQSIQNLEDSWGDANILLTPNLTQLPGKLVRGELASLKHGINNLGFIGVRRTEESKKLISWWKARLHTHCKLDKCRGIFVDQKWIDLVPLFFEGIKSVKHPGWNMAWWNLSERKLIREEGTYYVNSLKDKLIFFHFSGFRPGVSSMTERIKSAEFDMESEGPLRMLFDAYQDTLYARGFLELSKIKPLIKFREEPNDLRHRVGRKVKSKMTNAIYRIFGV